MNICKSRRRSLDLFINARQKINKKKRLAINKFPKIHFELEIKDTLNIDRFKLSFLPYLLSVFHEFFRLKATNVIKSGNIYENLKKKF